MSSTTLKLAELSFVEECEIKSISGIIYLVYNSGITIGFPTQSRTSGFQLLSPLNTLNPNNNTEWGLETNVYLYYKESLESVITNSNLSSYNSIWDAAYSPQLGIALAVSSPNGSTNAYTSNDGATWTSQTTSGTGQTNTLVGIDWSPQLGIFCIVGVNGTNRSVITPNGVNYTLTNIDNTSNWYRVVWSQELGIFCAVAEGGTYSYAVSSDGIDWTHGNINTQGTTRWLDVCWSPELMLFAACGFQNAETIATSPDGLNWTVRPSGTSNQNYKAISWSPLAGVCCSCRFWNR